MTKPSDGDAAELARALMIGIQVLKYTPPKEFMKREEYERAFARHLAGKLMAAGWEFSHVPKNTWTGDPV